MADREIILDILNDALTKEEMAEHNCEEILLKLRQHNIIEDVDKIKNDEIEHQKIIKKIISLL